MKRNLFDVSSIVNFDEEVFETLISGQGFQLKRIVSSGQATPPNEWYDQSTNEWVVLLSGFAQVFFQETGETVELIAGDYVFIPAHQKHRVVQTDPNEKTIWLAIYFDTSK